MVKVNKFIKQKYKSNEISVLQFKKNSKKFFKDMSDTYHNFLCSYFDINDKGELDGFKFVRGFIKS